MKTVHVWVLVVMAGLVLGCRRNNNRACQTNDDCGQAQVCSNGLCIPVSTSSSSGGVGSSSTSSTSGASSTVASSIGTSTSRPASSALSQASSAPPGSSVGDPSSGVASSAAASSSSQDGSSSSSQMTNSSSLDCAPACENGSTCINGTCVCPETDQEICTRLDLNCEALNATDVCGLPRTVDCGTCLTACVNNTCQPQCLGITPDAINYSLLTDLSDLNSQDILAGSNGDGTVLAVLRPPTGQQCLGPFHLWVASGHPQLSWTMLDITAAVANVFVLDNGSEQGFAVLNDTTTNFIVGRTPNLRFTTVDLSNTASVSAGPFATINAWLDTQSVNGVDGLAVSGDGLSFAFRIVDVNGIPQNKMSDRASLADDFPVPTDVGDILNEGAQSYVVTGISQDRLSIFVMSNWSTSLVHRETVLRPFGNNPVPVGGYFRVYPLRGCAQILANQTDAACVGENIVSSPVR